MPSSSTPSHDELFTAIKGKGAQLNGTPIRTSTCVRIEEALVGTVIPAHGSARLAAYLPVLNALIPKCAGIRRAGTCALDLAYVAAGRLDGFWEMGLNPWNVAAGALLVVEAGGRVGDFAGGLEFMRTQGRDRRGAGRVQSAARRDCGGGAAAALILGAPVGGSSATAHSVIAGDAGHRPQQRAEAGRLDDRPQQPDGGRAHAEGHEEAHAAHARANPVVDEAHDHRVGERYRAEDHDHERDLQREERPAGGIGGGDEERRLQRHDARGRAASSDSGR